MGITVGMVTMVVGTITDTVIIVAATCVAEGAAGNIEIVDGYMRSRPFGRLRFFRLATFAQKNKDTRAGILI
jgi:hypothetical protein